jgi:putative SOS response-associated peptidase YedK
VINRYVGNLPPMPGVFPDYSAPVVRNTDTGHELAMMRWGMPAPPRTGGTPVTNIRNTSSPHWRVFGEAVGRDQAAVLRFEPHARLGWW